LVQKVKLLKDRESHTEYEKVKNEWKEHYEQIRLLKKQHKTAQKTQNINRALSNMQGALNRLGIENLTNTQISGPTQALSVESSQEALESKVKESLDIIAAEMGIMSKNKDTLGKKDTSTQAFQEVSTPTYSKKTIGKKA
jgi:hypothetical protein